MRISRLRLLIPLSVLLLTVNSAYISNDVVSNYAEVRELLSQYYQRSARRIAHDYDPRAIEKEAEASHFDDGTEATINRKIWTEVFEHDIILTLDQAQNLLKEQKEVHSRGKRQAEPNPSKFWTNLTISYEFAVNDSKWREQIRQALRHVESQTCFTFREGGIDRNRLQFIRGSGCWSNVGMIGGRQQVSVGYGCEWLGIISHETLHALGLWHEQSRYDRDNYISLVTGNIIRGTIGNFERRTPSTSDNINQPYDLGSVMHYGPKAFTTDWSQNTITTKDANFQNTIGQRDGLSFKDAKMINTRYCTRVCPYNLPCQNEGYTDPNNCYYCRCAHGYGGRYCEHVEYVPGSVGGELIAYDSWYRIISEFLKPETNTVYRIRAAPGQRIELLFEEVSFLCRDTCKSYVELKYKATKTQAGARLCCKTPSTPIISENNEVVVIYRGEDSLPDGYHGFTLRYRIYKVRAMNSVKVRVRAPAKTKAPLKDWKLLKALEYRKPMKKFENKKTVEGNQISEFVLRDPPQTIAVLRDPTQTPQTIAASLGCDGSPEKSLETIPTAKPQPPTGFVDTRSTVAPRTTERPTTTTVITSTTEGSTTGMWGDWGDWSTCSHACGGCGTRLRIRACYKGNRQCLGESKQEEPCNIHECRYPKKETISTGSCQGRIVLPCDLMEKLYFGQRQRDETARFKRSLGDPNNCEKPFEYACPTGLLTIHLDWRGNSDPQADPPACCEGYYANGGNCYKY
ncbi:unnamed protein product, partial [Mesorhabditis belari]|uniref:Zinc metalloproteinase n=1 Tax=Mesorhabditis belari TaxID=2138241 RepID=A0AAF3FNJ5_9BILA